jgi:hypothetical protein
MPGRPGKTEVDHAGAVRRRSNDHIPGLNVAVDQGRRGPVQRLEPFGHLQAKPGRLGSRHPARPADALFECLASDVLHDQHVAHANLEALVIVRDAPSHQCLKLLLLAPRIVLLDGVEVHHDLQGARLRLGDVCGKVDRPVWLPPRARRRRGSGRAR